MMPEGLWATLSDHEIRSLVAYLASPFAGADAGDEGKLSSSLFNGRDLTGWDGDPKLWKVEGGEIVGKTAGLSRNEFLRSDLALGDFRLTVKVKLVKPTRGTAASSSAARPSPTVRSRGYQADVGVGWWGKLYEEHGRGLLWPESGEAHVRQGGLEHV